MGEYRVYHRHDGGIPRHFQALYAHDDTLYVYEGAALTWGTSEQLEGGAEDRLRQRCAALEGDGWTLSDGGSYVPGNVDEDVLTTQIRDGARLVFEATVRAHPDETPAGFVLYTDGSRMTVAAAMTTREAAAEDDDHLFNVGEWPYESAPHHLDTAYRTILTQHRELPAGPWREFVEAFDRACENALKALTEDGVFGDGQALDEVVILFQVMDDDGQHQVAMRLNSPTVGARYRNWLKRNL